MKISWRSEVPQWLAMAAMFAAAAWTWRGAPERVPVHWNLAGQVDRYGGKVEGLLFVPLLTIAIYALLIVLPRFDPGRANYARFAGAYTVIRIAVVTVMALIYGVTILSILGRPVDVATWVPLLVGAMFVLLGSVMGRLQPNWFVGIRTPWTLSSRLSWARTHRVGGWLFAISGLAFIAVSVVRAAWAVIGVFALMLSTIVGLVIYSYLVWRADPDKVPPGGAAPEA